MNLLFEDKYVELSYDEMISLDGGYDIWVYVLGGCIEKCQEWTYDFCRGAYDGASKTMFNV